MWTWPKPLDVWRGLAGGLFVAAITFMAYRNSEQRSPAELVVFVLVTVGPILLVTLLAARTNRRLRGPDES